MVLQRERSTMDERPLRLAVAGLGAIGMRTAQAVDAGEVPGIRLVAVSAKNLDRARERVSGFTGKPKVLPLGELASSADIVVECAPAAVFAELASAVIESGGCLVPLSVGALLDYPELVERARETGARIVVPTGALIGLDTVRAMAEGRIHEVTLMTRKPPGGLAGAPYLVENGIDISNLAEPLCVLRGNARQAAAAFPANVNVAAALALAGVGPERTQVEVWADPTIDRNIQSVSIVSDSGEATMTMNNVPSADNPRTGRIVANSVVTTLRRMTATLVAGS
jgi:aspartate dehydrogenase